MGIHPDGTLKFSLLTPERAHIEYRPYFNGPMLCGEIPAEWLTNVADKNHEVDIVMGDAGYCQHRLPRNERT